MKKGIFKYNEEYISNCLKKFSDDFEPLEPVGSVIQAALDIVYTSSQQRSESIKFPISSYPDISGGSGQLYLQYEMLCQTVQRKSYSSQQVNADQNKWFTDPNLTEVDPLAVFGLKISLWGLHGQAPEGTLSTTCPVCGFVPDFFYINSDGEMFLVCARCDYDWRYRRTSCSFCGSDNPTNISYLVSTDNFARMRECHTCGRKLCGVDARHAKRPFCYILEKLITGHVLGSVNPAQKSSQNAT
ncbi:MAG: hypothetical protein ACYCPP_02535 [Nitrososphaerales archaeon]